MALDGPEGDDEDEDEALARRLATCNAAGFVVVLEVAPKAGTITVLSPCPGKLPSRHLVVGSGEVPCIKWMDEK